MIIDKRTLNLVCPVETESGVAYIHSMPIRPETFRQYFLVLSKTLNELYAQGLSQGTGPRIAALLLQKIATDSGEWEGTAGVQNGLLNEIIRLSNVLACTEQGWRSLPISEALKQGILDERDVEEAKGFITFFTCVSHIHKRSEISAILNLMGRVWDTQTTLLNATEFAASLPILTPAETFVATVPASSLPG
jgi:hypothetical protein